MVNSLKDFGDSISRNGSKTRVSSMSGGARPPLPNSMVRSNSDLTNYATHMEKKKLENYITSQEPEITSHARRPRQKKVMVKSNSTSSLFLNKLIPHSADAAIMVKCMSRAVFYEILRNTSCACNDIFCEMLHPLDSSYECLDMAPSLKEVERLLKKIFKNQMLSAECAVMAIAYIEKIRQRKVYLCSHTWRRVLLGAILLSEKVWEDQTVWNVDYTKSFPEIEVDDLRNLEREFLIKIQFQLTLRPSEYARYYFALSSLRESTEENYPLKPLTKETAKRLEANAMGIEDRAKIAYIHERPYKSYNCYAPNSQITLEQLRQIRSSHKDEIFI
jgi:hypothetical protein